ncbi:hypothetical protein CIG75_08780 [Tumebacillus algifaecis]|uniref:Uncharacterized protein n=1 Tax=Tumebacillus algifaecis TaxID=1214604 RepID=A0A223D0W0_9BACL|nr:hypothetical protein [Tumebacillus algifaecis]ASS75063.1 hypothetical protein CIG75_08780 [Tumebacillus algifaecis]
MTTQEMLDHEFNFSEVTLSFLDPGNTGRGKSTDEITPPYPSSPTPGNGPNLTLDEITPPFPISPVEEDEPDA